MTTTRMKWLAGAALLILGAPSMGAAQQQNDLALVYRLLLDGQAVVTPGAGGGERTAALGDRLNNRDVITTTPNTRAAIQFADDGSLVRLNPSSQLQITATGDRGSMVKTVQMDVGELWARVTRGEGERRFNVQTPSGVAAVKGTEFIVRSDAQGTTVITLDGVVEFFNNAGTVDVTAGNIVTVAPGQAPPPPRRATSEELAGFQALIEDESGTAETDRVQVEITVQDAEGRSRTLIMELPRGEVRAILGGGR